MGNTSDDEEKGFNKTSYSETFQGVGSLRRTSRKVKMIGLIMFICILFLVNSISNTPLPSSSPSQIINNYEIDPSPQYEIIQNENIYLTPQVWILPETSFEKYQKQYNKGKKNEC